MKILKNKQDLILKLLLDLAGCGICQLQLKGGEGTAVQLGSFINNECVKDVSKLICDACADKIDRGMGRKPGQPREQKEYGAYLKIVFGGPR